MYSALDQPMSPDFYNMLDKNLGDTLIKPMTLAATYETSAGKFPSAYGNVALLDCHYVLQYMIDYSRNVYAPTLPLI